MATIDYKLKCIMLTKYLFHSRISFDENFARVLEPVVFGGNVVAEIVDGEPEQHLGLQAVFALAAQLVVELITHEGEVDDLLQLEPSRAGLECAWGYGKIGYAISAVGFGYVVKMSSLT